MVTNIMLGSVSHEYVKLITSKSAFEAFSELENMFLHRARVATMRMLITCKMQEGSSASAHLKRIKGYLNHLESLGSPIREGIAVDMVLASLAGSLDDWALRLVKDGWEGSLWELRKLFSAMELEKAKAVNSSSGIKIREGRVVKPGARKSNGKGKGKDVAYNGRSLKRCHYCGDIGHLKRLCPMLLAEMMQEKCSTAEFSGMLFHTFFFSKS